MSPRRMFRSRARWMSAAAVLVVAGVLAGTMLASAAGPPLPKRTPAQLLVAMRNARPPAAFTGVITETANLGFPSLPNIPGLQSSVLSGASAITGTHTFDIWYGGPRHLRIAVPVSFGETDLRVNGNQVWLWNSHGQTATHYILPAAPSGAQIRRIQAIPSKLSRLPRPRLLPRCLVAVRQRLRSHPARPATARAAILKCLRSLKIGRQVPANFKPLTPQQAANKFLAALGPTTKVTVPGSTVVAGRSAYQLVIAPRTSQSLISQIVIAVDSKTHLPLQLQVFARGTSGPVFQIGFTSLSFGQPAASNFTFTPPAGAHVKTEKLFADMPGLLGPLSLGGLPAPLPGPFTSQRFLPSSSRAHIVHIAQIKGIARIVKSRIRIGMLKPVCAAALKSASSARPRRVALKALHARCPRVLLWHAFAKPLSGGGVFSSAAPDGVKVLGSGWLSVAVIPAGGALSLSPAKRLFPYSAPVSGTHSVIASSGAASANQILELLRILLNSASPVHGTWGAGRLLRTSLLSVLITNNGKVLIGAVTPAALFADAAKVK